MNEPIFSFQTASCPECSALAIEPVSNRLCRLASSESREDILAVCVHHGLIKKAFEAPEDEDVKEPCDICEHWIIVEDNPGTFVAQEIEADGTLVNIHRCPQCKTLFKFQAY